MLYVGLSLPSEYEERIHRAFATKGAENVVAKKRKTVREMMRDEERDR